MILRISIENLFSFLDETEISFIAGKSTSHAKQVSRAEKRDDISVLKFGAIYGANASGKSNIIKAVDILQRIALGSIPKRNIEPFKLVSPNERPSKVEVEIKIGNRFFAYGVVFTLKGIVEEWLFEINRRKDSLIFTRKNAKGEVEFDFGQIQGDEETAQFLKFIMQSTPVTNSFLSEYVKRNGVGLPLIGIVYNWMKQCLKIIFPSSRYEGISIRAEKDKDFADTVRALLAYFNTGIVDIRRIKIHKEDLDLPQKMVYDLWENVEPGKSFAIASVSDASFYFIETDLEGVTTVYKQKTIHKTKDGDEVSFEMYEESDGSIRLLDFIPMLVDLQLNDVTYLVDEIDRSMHPMLSQKLLEYYFNHLSDKRDTQLICSTHESNLLNQELIRADEIWFVEKTADGASHLTSLAEFKPREDIRKGYLQGRYGAIPFFAPLEKLMWNNTNETEKEF